MPFGANSMRSHVSYQAAQVANATVCNMQQHRCGNYGNMQMLQVEQQQIQTCCVCVGGQMIRLWMHVVLLLSSIGKLRA